MLGVSLSFNAVIAACSAVTSFSRSANRCCVSEDADELEAGCAGADEAAAGWAAADEGVAGGSSAALEAGAQATKLTANMAVAKLEAHLYTRFISKPSLPTALSRFSWIRDGAQQITDAEMNGQTHLIY
jgi:hypothetical protein